MIMVLTGKGFKKGRLGSHDTWIETPSVLLIHGIQMAVLEAMGFDHFAANAFSFL